MAVGDIVFQAFAYGIPTLIFIGIAMFAIKKYKKRSS